MCDETIGIYNNKDFKALKDFKYIRVRTVDPDALDCGLQFYFLAAKNMKINKKYMKINNLSKLLLWS